MSSERGLPNRKRHRLSMDVYATTEFEYSFTVCARHLTKPFRDPILAKLVVDSLLWTKHRYGWLLYCYCLMPDHLHFVCRLKRDELSRVSSGVLGERKICVLDHLARFKSFTTNQAWKHGVRGKLWQRSSYDRVLDLARPFEEVVQYTLENPQRAGLVRDWQDWPYAKIVDPWWN